MLTVCGAGSVGLAIGARAACAGRPVLFLVRRPEVAATIARDGVRLENLATGEVSAATARATADVSEAARVCAGGPVVFCMRAPDLEAAAGALAQAAPGAVVAAAQNGVDADGVLARYFERVIGVVVRGTCTRTAPNGVLGSGPGRFVIGSHPEGCDADARDLAHTLRAAGADVGLSSHLAEDRWLKLCVNLMSTPNALVRRPDHTSAAFVDIKVRLLEEADAALRAAGIAARSCDGRDRSIPEEIDHLRESFAHGESARHLPLYNQVWAALRHGGPLEADAYHRRILDLAARHGLEAPQNARVLAALERAHRESLGPERATARELLAG